MITKESIDRVNEADLVEVINKCISKPLARAGANWKANSPFNDERSASFLVSPAKNVWKCFSSGKGGVGAVTFIMELQNKSWYEAIVTVAELSNIILQYAELDDEEKERQVVIENQRFLLSSANKKYRKYYTDLIESHWAKQNIANRNYSEITIEQFQIGYSVPNSNDLAAPLIEKGRITDGLETGLICKKENRYFDFFNDRLMFPILDDRGRPIAFGGRASNEAIVKKSPKYLNSPETNHYKKEMVLYGFFQARQSIVKYNKAYLTEGYTDVIAFHDKNVNNTIATCGTALTPEHIKKLKKLTNHIILVRDGDPAGVKASLRDIDLILEANMLVSIVPLPDKEDPDTLANIQGEKLQEWLDNNCQDALLWKATKLKIESKNPNDLAISATELAATLIKIKDPIKRKGYAKDCAKKLGVALKDFSDKIDSLLNLEIAKRKRDSDSYEDEKYELMSYGFPEDGDVAQYKKDGYVLAPEEKAIYFYIENEKSKYFFKGANFTCNPLFVIKSSKGQGKRLIEFENSVGEKTVFSLDNKEISNFTQFKEKIVDGYNFTFDGKTSNYHFTQFKNKMLYQFNTADELLTYGYQKEGFLAFANGIAIDQQFWGVDDYGMVNVEIEEDKEEGIKGYKNMFYSPPFSKINIGNREDDDSYEGVRKFVFLESDIVFNQWMDLFIKVYGKEKGMIGIAFAISGFYRSIIVEQFGSFPFLFLTGSKNSGKTTFCESITNLFMPGEKAFDLNSGSMVAFYRVVSRFRDIVIGLEEFTDQIHEIKFQSLKGSYDDRARETGQATNDNKTNKVKIKSACIILSQYISVRDDNSLTSRSITMNFLEQNYTADQKETFGRLKTYEKKGMTSMLLELLKYRKLIEKEYSVQMEQINRQLLKDISGDYMERMLQNFVSVMVPVKILYKKFNWPFSWDEFYSHCLETILSSSDVISDTEGTAVFWRTLEFLIDQKRVHNKIDFFIDPKPIVTIYPKKNEPKEFVNKAGDKILFLRLGQVHQHYVETVSRRKNEEPIGEATLRNYFKSKSYYIGAVKGINFETGSFSCYAFNYTMMEKNNVLNIIRDFEKSPKDVPKSAFMPSGESYSSTGEEHDDLPF